MFCNLFKGESIAGLPLLFKGETALGDTDRVELTLDEVCRGTALTVGGIDEPEKLFNACVDCFGDVVALEMTAAADRLVLSMNRLMSDSARGE